MRRIKLFLGGDGHRLYHLRRAGRGQRVFEGVQRAPGRDQEVRPARAGEECLPIRSQALQRQRRPSQVLPEEALPLRATSAEYAAALYGRR
jgi:hypothetical protein